MSTNSTIPQILIIDKKAAQVFEICKQLELALKYIDKVRDTPGMI